MKYCQESAKMHELGIAKTIVEIAIEESNHKIVKEIHLKLSKIDQIVADSLMFYFDIIKMDYQNLNEAELKIEYQPLIGKCIQCKTKYSIDDLFFLCPKCNNGLEIIEGQEMFIDKIIIYD